MPMREDPLALREGLGSPYDSGLGVERSLLRSSNVHHFGCRDGWHVWDLPGMPVRASTDWRVGFEVAGISESSSERNGTDGEYRTENPVVCLTLVTKVQFCHELLVRGD